MGFRPGPELTPQQTKVVLDERARRLARPLITLPDDADVTALLEFGLGGERFAVDARLVHEVLSAPSVTPLPGTPPFLGGVCALRGHPLVVYELRTILGLPSVTVATTRPVVVLGQEAADMGLRVDRVDAVLSVRRADIHPPPDHVSPSLQRFLLGRTDHEVYVLDAPRLLTHRELIVDDLDPDGKTAGQGKPS